MPDRYIKFPGGGSPSTGTDWNNAYETGAAAAAVDLAGDRFFFSDTHAEVSTGGITWALAGTPAQPSQLLCVDDSVPTPTTLATTATVTSGGAIAITGSALIHGITFSGGAASTFNGSSASAIQRYDLCSFQNSAGNVAFGHGGLANVSTRTECRETTFKFPGAGNTVSISGDMFIQGGSLLSGGSSPTNFFTMAANDRTFSRLLVDGFDFSAATATMNLCAAGALGNAIATFRECKLPDSWSGSLVSGTILVGQRYELRNRDRLWVEDYAGSIKRETTIVRSGGASDGTTPISWKIAMSTNAEYPLVVLRSPEMAVWNDVVGSPVTFSVEIAMNDGSAPLTDAQAYLEVYSLGPDGSPSQMLPWKLTSDVKADVLANAQTQEISTAAWDNLGSPGVTQKLSCTVTPQYAGYLVGVICAAAANRIFYACPKPTIS